MLKVLLHYPEWGNRWIPYFIEELASKYQLTITHEIDLQKLRVLSARNDVLISMWLNNVVSFWTNEFPNKYIISYLRRYELWELNVINQIKYENLNALIFVAKYYKDIFENSFTGDNGPKTYLIPNAVNPKEFLFKEHKPGTKIAFAGQLKHVKNFPLALQILQELPKKYTLHHAGLATDQQMAGQIMSYTHELGLGDRAIFYDQIDPAKMPEWYHDKDYLLSTSLNEGNPNNVIECMAMGIKPIIHAWPGARDQFPEDLIFTKISEAKKIITENKYESARYRDWITRFYPYSNIKKIHKVIKDVTGIK